MIQKKEMPKMEEHEVYKWLDKKLGQFRMGWISGFITLLSVIFIIEGPGLVKIIPLIVFLLNIPRIMQGK